MRFHNPVQQTHIFTLSVHLGEITAVLSCFAKLQLFKKWPTMKALCSLCLFLIPVRTLAVDGWWEDDSICLLPY